MLFIGGEGLVRGAVSIAQKMKISTLLVSTVVVGFGTSMPEMTVSIQAALDGSPDIALGNVVGSNICNILLILGIAALISPVAARGMAIMRDAWVVVLVSVLLVLASFMPQGGLILGLGFIAVLVAYLVFSYRQDRATIQPPPTEGEVLLQHAAEDMHAEGMGLARSVVYAVGGIGILIFGAKMLVIGAVDIARAFNLSEAVIGLTLVAIGTSLPELATAVIASLKKHSDIIIGNVLGSNIFNILAILGVTMTVAPIPFTSEIADRDIWIMLGAAVVVLPVILTGKVISRKEGLVFFTAYIAYTAFLLYGG